LQTALLDYHIINTAFVIFVVALVVVLCIVMYNLLLFVCRISLQRDWRHH